MSIGSLAAVFVPECFPAVLEPLRKQAGDKTGEKNIKGLEEGEKLENRGIYKAFFFTPWTYASTFVCVHNKRRRFNMCVVFSELKKACSRASRVSSPPGNIAVSFN